MSPSKLKDRRNVKLISRLIVIVISAGLAFAQRTSEKPVLHGRHWLAITGKPLAATAGARIFMQGGNAVDAACAMLAATCTMFDVLSWGGETQALIYNPHTKKIIAVNGLGVAPSGATADFFKGRGYKYPPAYGPLAAVTPGTPGGLMLMLAEFGTLSLKAVLAPAMEMAEGYPMERETADSIEGDKEQIKKWPYSRKILLPHPGESREAPYPGEIFSQPDLLLTLKKLVAAEQQALQNGKDRKTAIYAAYDRFYRGDIADEFVRGCQEQGGLITLDDLANWKPLLEEPVMTTYKGIEVYKLSCWVQGPVMLQALNMLENLDLRAMGLNSVRYIHTLYQVMNLAFADRDFYYGDPYFPPEEPLKGTALQGIRPPAPAADRLGEERSPLRSRRSLSLRRQEESLAAPAVSPEGQGAGQGIFQPGTRKDQGRFFDRHHLDPGLRPGRMGGLGHAQRRLDPRLHRRQHRYRHEPAGAELRPR